MIRLTFIHPRTDFKEPDHLWVNPDNILIVKTEIINTGTKETATIVQFSDRLSLGIQETPEEICQLIREQNILRQKSIWGS